MERAYVAVFSAALYLFIVRALRYRRVDAIKRKYGMLKRDDLSKLTADQAQEVLQELVEMEFPQLFGFSVVFALFKTYAVPSVSSLLVTTGELSRPETASKRIADTGVLILEFCLNNPSSERSMQAIVRMNYIHSRYIKAGKISNDDLLYTLSLFALEPTRWINDHEWRHLSDLEMCSAGTFWKAIGDQMAIDFSPLRSYKTGWKDGLQWLDEVRTWSEGYEGTNVRSAPTNRKLALAHLDVIFLNIPRRWHYIMHWLVATLLGERMRQAMLLPEPPRLFVAALEWTFTLRKLMLRHLMLPRPEFMRKQHISASSETDGRYSSHIYLTHPWYVKPTFTRRWGLAALFTRMIGRKLPGDDGNKYNPEGYSISEIGPFGTNKSVGTDLAEMRDISPGGCPFSRIKV